MSDESDEAKQARLQQGCAMVTEEAKQAWLQQRNERDAACRTMVTDKARHRN